MIFDSLTHVTPDGRWFHTAFDATEDRLVREMDECGVERAAVVALAGHIPNDFVLRLCRKRADRFVPCGSVDPAQYRSAKRAASEFRAQFRDAGFRALKLHPRLNRYDPLDPRCLAVLEEMASWKAPLPVWLDTLFYFPGGKLRKPLVDTIHELVSRFPGLRFVLLHGGGSWVLQVAEAVRDCPNAWLDISFTAHRYAGSSVAQDLRFLISTFDRRLVFGSDFPEVSIAEALRDFRDLAQGVAREKCDNILAGNLDAILRQGTRP